MASFLVSSCLLVAEMPTVPLLAGFFLLLCHDSAFLGGMYIFPLFITCGGRYRHHSLLCQQYSRRSYPEYLKYSKNHLVAGTLLGELRVLLQTTTCRSLPNNSTPALALRASIFAPLGLAEDRSLCLWPPYGIGQVIIFLPCGFFVFFFFLA